MRVFFVISLVAVCFFKAVCGLDSIAVASSVENDPEFVEARRLFWSGQYNKSEALFKAFLVKHPGHKASNSFLKMIHQSRIFDPAKIKETRQRLESIRINEVNFKNTEWNVVADYLQTAANPKVNGRNAKESIHFIDMLPSKFSKKVTLNLKDISLMSVIEQVCEQARLRYVVDTWAVIIDLPEGKR